MPMLMNHDEHLLSRSDAFFFRSHSIHKSHTWWDPWDHRTRGLQGDPSSISIMGGTCSMVFPTSTRLLGKCWESSIQCLLGIQTLLKSLGFFGSQVSHLGQYLHVPCSKNGWSTRRAHQSSIPRIATFYPVHSWPKQSQLLVWNLRFGGKTPFFLGQTSMKNNWTHTKKP